VALKTSIKHSNFSNAFDNVCYVTQSNDAIFSVCDEIHFRIKIIKMQRLKMSVGNIKKSLLKL
jgi:hypothetical protein